MTLTAGSLSRRAVHSKAQAALPEPVDDLDAPAPLPADSLGPLRESFELDVLAEPVPAGSLEPEPRESLGRESLGREPLEPESLEPESLEPESLEPDSLPTDCFESALSPLESVRAEPFTFSGARLSVR